MLPKTSLFLALAASLALAGPASATSFSLTFDQVGNDIEFIVTLDQPESIIGYELTIQYDDVELDWVAFSNSVAGLSPLTPAPGDAEHDPTGMKAIALGLGAVVAQELFRISFVITNPIDDGAFDDFRVFLAPAGCDLLPGGCGDIPSNDTGIKEFPGQTPVQIDNAGFQVEIGSTTQVAAIPEPATLVLLAAALAPLALRRRLQA